MQLEQIAAFQKRLDDVEKTEQRAAFQKRLDDLEEPHAEQIHKQHEDHTIHPLQHCRNECVSSRRCNMRRSKRSRLHTEQTAALQKLFNALEKMYVEQLQTAAFQKRSNDLEEIHVEQLHKQYEVQKRLDDLEKICDEPLQPQQAEAQTEQTAAFQKRLDDFEEPHVKQIHKQHEDHQYILQHCRNECVSSKRRNTRRSIRSWLHIPCRTQPSRNTLMPSRRFLLSSFKHIALKIKRNNQSHKTLYDVSEFLKLNLSLNICMPTLYILSHLVILSWIKTP